MSTISLVTGASRGLGRNSALAIARRGGDVIVTYHSRSEDAAAVLAESRSLGRAALAFQLDTGDVKAFPAFAGRLPESLRTSWGRERIDHLVNNAGHGDYAPIGQTDEAQFDRLVDVHFKGAVEMLTRYQARELGERGIAVNTVAPDAIETDFGGGAVRDNPDINGLFAGMTALGRVGLPDDAGPMIAGQLSPDNRWVTAQRIEVSGGQGI